MRKLNQYLNIIYILKILRHLLPYPHLNSQEAIIVPTLTSVVKLINNIYTNSITSFHGNIFGATPPIHINRGTIQGCTLSPYLIIIFLDPLLRWLEMITSDITFNTSITTSNTPGRSQAINFCKPSVAGVN